MSIKNVFKKKFNIKNPIISLKKKKDKIKTVIAETPVDTYHKIDIDGVKTTNTETSLKLGNVGLYTNIDTNEKNESKKFKKKHKSIDINNEVEPTKKKKVMFADDVECKDKCTAGKMEKLETMNKKKKLNYIKKLKEKKKKQKYAKKCEKIAFANSLSRHERAIEYLIQWKNDRSNWKFRKMYQLWLIKNTYDSTLISKENFEILVEYLQTIEGKSRNIILECANNIIAEFSASNDEQELNLSQTNKYQRARTIIQMFG